MDIAQYSAALFDLDGVLTPTAVVHMTAWSEMFNQFLDSAGDQEPYTEADYFAYVDGRPRYDGVETFLASRSIELPWGETSDPATAATVCGLGNRKNDLFLEVLERDGVEPYAGSVAFLDSLPDTVQVAVVSSSRNARPVLTAAGLIDRFPVIVDGTVAAAEGLAGKPAPDTFRFAAEQLGVAVEHAVVYEDAVSGVEAGAAGGFGLVIGVDRGAGGEALRTSGADLVVQDLQELV